MIIVCQWLNLNSCYIVQIMDHLGMWVSLLQQKTSYKHVKYTRELFGWYFFNWRLLVLCSANNWWLICIKICSLYLPISLNCGIDVATSSWCASGAERLIVDVAANLANHGHHVHIFTSCHDKNQSFEETLFGNSLSLSFFHQGCVFGNLATLRVKTRYFESF